MFTVFLGKFAVKPDLVIIDSDSQANCCWNSNACEH